MTFLVTPETINPDSNLKETNLIGWFCQVSYVLDIDWFWFNFTMLNRLLKGSTSGNPSILDIATRTCSIPQV